MSNNLEVFISSLAERVNDLERVESAKAVTALVSGGVVFAEGNGLLQTDSTNFFWNNTDKTLLINSGLDATYKSYALFTTATLELKTLGTSDTYPLIAWRHKGGNRGGYLGWGNGGSGDKYIELRLENSNNFAILDGNVGIGTSSPLYLTHFLKSDATSTRTGAIGAEVGIENSNNGGQRYSGIRFKANDSSGGGTVYSTGRILGTFPAATFQDGSLIFQTVSAAETFQDVMIIRGLNVGLGTMAPAVKFHVVSPDDTTSSFARFVSNNLTAATEIWYGGLRAGGTNTSQAIEIISKGTGDVVLTAPSTGSVIFKTSATSRWYIDGNGHMQPSTAGTLNLGNATVYMNDVSYKTLTDRGCLAYIDTWEMPDGKKLSNLEVIRALKPHATNKTIYDEVMLDYDYVPKHSRKSAPIATEDTEFEQLFDKDGNKLKFKKGEKMGSDGVEMTSMFSVMLGSIREMASIIDTLQAKVELLEGKSK